VSNGDGPDHPFGPLVARFDEAADAALDRLRGQPVADRVFYTAARLGDWSMIWHLVAIARALVSPRRRREVVRVAALLGLESLLVNQVVKRFFRRPRPVAEGSHPHPLRMPSTSSFPSGHASSGAFAATVLGEHDRRGRPWWWAMAAVVAVSRPYVKAHHASDVVAGAVLGRVLGLAARRCWPQR
jgi:membrane-associated phospholipid phosphatase